VRRLCLGSKATTKPWKLRIRRSPYLVEDVLAAFRPIYNDARRKRNLLFSNTMVTFIDQWGTPEVGDDLGGLTAEMYTQFWNEVIKPELGLFERAAEGTGGYLPCASAPLEQLEVVGLVLVKCVLDDHPCGHGLVDFVFEYLVHGGAAITLQEPSCALGALCQYDGELARVWSTLLESPASVDGLQLSLESFDPAEEDGEALVTSDSIGSAVLQGCVARLLSARRAALDALRRGFLHCEDLEIQLAALGPSKVLALVLQGSQTLSASELLGCFVLPRESAEEEAAAGFLDAGSEVPLYFESLLLDETTFGENERLALLQWCTALSALPIGGLREGKIALRLYGPEVDDSTLPETHTCTRELHLPNYPSAAILGEKLTLALQHIGDGFHKE